MISKKESILESLLKSNYPQGWSVFRFGDLCDIQGGSQPPKSEFIYEPRKGYVRLLQIRDFGTNPVPTYIPIEKASKLCKKKDVLIARYGASLGRILTGMTGAYNVAIAKVLFNRDILYYRYLFYLLQTPYFQTPIHMVSRSAQNGFNKGELFPIELPLAPFNEQIRIVAEIEKQFSRLDEAVENLQRVKANVRRYKVSVHKAAMEGKLTEQWRAEYPDVEPASKLLVDILKKNRKKAYELCNIPIDTLPTTWCIAKMDQLIDYVTSGSRGWAKYYSKTGDLFIRAQNIKNDKLELDDVAYVKLPRRAEGKRTLVQRNDILITITGANVTKTAIVNCEFEQSAYINQHIALTRPTIPQIAEYLYFWIICPAYGRKSLEEFAYGAGKPGLNLTNIREVVVALPPLEEQKRIVQEINQIFTIVDNLELQVNRSLKYAEQLRQSILQKAFLGQLVSQSPDDEPVSNLLRMIRQKRKAIKQEPSIKRKQRRSEKGTRVKSKKSKRNISEVLTEFSEGITPEMLLKESNYSIDEIDAFYMQLGKIADKIEQIKPKGEEAFKWPYEAEVILRLRSD